MPSWEGGSSHSYDFLLLWLLDPSRAARVVGRAWGHVKVREEKRGTRLLGSTVTRKRGRVIFLLSDEAGEEGAPTPDF